MPSEMLEIGRCSNLRRAAGKGAAAEVDGASAETAATDALCVAGYQQLKYNKKDVSYCTKMDKECIQEVGDEI